MRHGEGIVQTPNRASGGTCEALAAKAVAGTKIPRLERAVPVQVRPPAPHFRKRAPARAIRSQTTCYCTGRNACHLALRDIKRIPQFLMANLLAAHGCVRRP